MVSDRLMHRAFGTWALAIMVLYGMTGCSGDGAANGPDPDEARLKKDIEAQLPRGSDVPKIESFLKANGFEYSVGSPTGTIHAIRRNVAKRGMVSKSVRVEFSTTDGKLDSYKTDVVYTGP